MATSLADEAIALLIELAEQGEIDPWDVQVIDVIDRFLTQLAPTANTRDLSESGQAFLYASMLVFLKALALDEQAHEGEPDDQLDDPNWYDTAETLTAVPLEHVLSPRPVARISRTRPVTLKELIEQLHVLEISVRTQDSKRHQRVRKAPLPSAKERMATVSQLTHSDNLAETVALLTPLLEQAWQHSSTVDFATLLALQQEHHPEHSSLTHVFWALLVMASRSQVSLHQEEFYQDLALSPILLTPTSCESEIETADTDTVARSA